MTEFVQNIQSNAYFQSLPNWVQESVFQTDVPLASEADLRAFAENLLGKLNGGYLFARHIKHFHFNVSH